MMLTSAGKIQGDAAFLSRNAGALYISRNCAVAPFLLSRRRQVGVFFNLVPFFKFFEFFLKFFFLKFE